MSWLGLDRNASPMASIKLADVRASAERNTCYSSLNNASIGFHLGL